MAVRAGFRQRSGLDLGERARDSSGLRSRRHLYVLRKCSRSITHGADVVPNSIPNNVLAYTYHLASAVISWNEREIQRHNFFQVSMHELDIQRIDSSRLYFQN